MRCPLPPSLHRGPGGSPEGERHPRGGPQGQAGKGVCREGDGPRRPPEFGSAPGHWKVEKGTRREGRPSQGRRGRGGGRRGSGGG